MKFFHCQERGLERFLRHPWIVEALKAVTHSHAETGTQSCKRKPVAWSMLLAGELFCHQWGPAARVQWLALGTPFFFLARAGEMFPSKEGHWDDGHIFTTVMHLFSGWYSTRLDNIGSGWSHRVSVSELKKGSIAGRDGDDACLRGSTSLLLRDGGGAVELMIESLSSCMFLPSHAPLAAYGTARGNWLV